MHQRKPVKREQAAQPGQETGVGSIELDAAGNELLL